MPVYDLIGSTLSSTTARACGLCGTFRKLSGAHVPPQAAGNTAKVMRAPDVIVDGIRRPGTWRQGGMWVRGLCEDCNNRAGSNYDAAYADFARQVAALSTPTARSLAVIRGEVPAALFAPGLVSRAVLYGMFAINPRLRVLFPDLTHDLLHETPAGAGPIRWPDKLALKVARTHPSFPGEGVLSSGVWVMRVDVERVVHPTLGDIVWPPAGMEPGPERSRHRGQGARSADHGPLEDISGWLRWGPDRTSTDLRALIRILPGAPHPMLARTDDWVEFLTRDGSDADAIVVFGRQP